MTKKKDLYEKLREEKQDLPEIELEVLEQQHNSHNDTKVPDGDHPEKEQLTAESNSQIRFSTEVIDLNEENEMERAKYKSVNEGAEGEGELKDITVEEAVEYIGFGLAQWRMLIICGACWSADAMEVMLLSFLLPTLKETWTLSKTWEAALGGAVFSGIALGGYFWGMISDMWGRRIGYVAVAGFSAVFGLASAFSRDVIMFLCLQTALGFGLGGSSVPFSLFAEFLPTKSRGSFLVYFEFFWTVGTIGEAGLAWLLLPRTDIQGWRWLLGVSSIPMFLLLLCWPLLLESPRYLLVKGRYKEALAVLNRAAALNGKEPIKARLIPPPASKHQGQVWRLVTPPLLWISLPIWAIWFVNNLVYYGLVFFSPELFSNEKMSVYLSTFIETLAELPGLFLGAILINRLGRKWSQFALLASSSLFLFLLLAPVPSSWWVTACAFCARLTILAAFCIIWVYTPEVYPTPIRATALGACTSFAKIAAIITPWISNFLSDVDIRIPSIIYGSCAVVAALCALPLKETLGKALPDSLESSSSHPVSAPTPVETAGGLESQPLDSVYNLSSQPNISDQPSPSSPSLN